MSQIQMYMKFFFLIISNKNVIKIQVSFWLTLHISKYMRDRSVYVSEEVDTCKSYFDVQVTFTRKPTNYKLKPRHNPDGSLQENWGIPWDKTQRKLQLL